MAISEAGRRIGSSTLPIRLSGARLLVSDNDGISDVSDVQVAVLSKTPSGSSSD